MSNILKRGFDAYHLSFKPGNKKIKSSRDTVIAELPLDLVCAFRLFNIQPEEEEGRFTLKWALKPKPHFEIIWKFRNQVESSATITTDQISHVWLSRESKDAIFLHVDNHEEEVCSEFLTKRQHRFECSYVALLIQNGENVDVEVGNHLQLFLASQKVKYDFIDAKVCNAHMLEMLKMTKKLSRGTARSGRSTKLLNQDQSKHTESSAPLMKYEKVDLLEEESKKHQEESESKKMEPVAWERKHRVETEEQGRSIHSNLEENDELVKTMDVKIRSLETKIRELERDLKMKTPLADDKADADVEDLDDAMEKVYAAVQKMVNTKIKRSDKVAESSIMEGKSDVYTRRFDSPSHQHKGSRERAWRYVGRRRGRRHARRR